MAPVLRRSQFRNILSGDLRRKSLACDQAIEIQTAAESPLTGAEFEGDSRAVLELVLDNRRSAYDGEFVTLAIKLDTKLVTLQRELRRAFPARTVALHDASRTCRRRFVALALAGYLR